MLIIEVISCSNKVNLLAVTISVSLMISTQYLNSCASFGVSSVVVRHCGAWWCVSVPVSVLFPVVPVSCCPCLFAPVG